MTTFRLSFLSHGSHTGDNHTWRQVHSCWARCSRRDHSKDLGGHNEEEGIGDDAGCKVEEHSKDLGGDLCGDFGVGLFDDFGRDYGKDLYGDLCDYLCEDHNAALDKDLGRDPFDDLGRDRNKV